MNDLTNTKDFDSKEMGFEGGFIRKYTGKDYGDGDPATEVVTTGIEHFLTPYEMMKLYRQDPEHFFYVLGVIQRTRARAGLPMPTTGTSRK